MNVPDTSSHSDTPMCQKWSTNVKQKKSYGLDTNLQTDGQSDFYIPPELCSQGYNKTQNQHCSHGHKLLM